VFWLLKHSYVPYQLCSPLFLVSVLAAVSLGAWAYPMAILVPWTAFFTHILRHWRIEVLKFRAGQLIDKDGKEIPIGQGDSERHDQKRTFRLRCCYVGTFFLGAMCMFMYAAILFTNRDEFAVDFRDKMYPLCDLEFSNNRNHDENSYSLDTMDSIVLCDTAYLENENITQSQLLRYFGTSSYCTDFVNTSNCDPDKWRMIHHNYDSHPVWFHLHHPQSKLHVISIRGTWDFNDFMQDMVLFAEIISLQFIGIFIPIFNIWSHSLISTIVDTASLWSGAMYPDANKAYYEKPYQHLQDLGIPREDEYLLTMGHSLGGGVAQIIAAKMFDQDFRNVRSFSLSAPGVLYSTKKFDFSVQGLAYTSINALGERDPFTYVDRHLGLLTTFECNRELSVDCHSSYQSMCEVAGSCWSQDSAKEGAVDASKFNYVVQECDNPTNSGGR